jgi:5S rRNA maturation endonuclease (ribonuclease M5)
LIDKREKLYQQIGEFIGAFVTDLNHLSEDGWSLLVEGQRDAKALRKLGFTGSPVTISSVGRRGTSVLGESKKVIILTDLDREGAVLASRYVKRLSHEGFKTSLRERLRMKIASRGVFLHVENLSRFAHEDA